jgi:membrane protein YdbS with pleckstrin-like domain
MEKLHPGARWIFRIRAYSILLFLMIFFSIWGWGFIAVLIGISLPTILVSLIVSLVLLVVIGEIYARMAYNRWFYEFAPHNLRLERGIIWKRYSNIPYERIQNVDIHRGILARMLGYSTVDIQTAGFHMATGRGGMSEGHIPAVSKEGAERIREFLMKKIGKRQGL